VRSVCRVNNATMPVKALRALGQLLVDFNGQGAAASLAHEGAQMDLLDDWAVGSDRCCSPRHRMPFDSWNKGLKCIA
jgi:DNA repair ATPase RecN